MLRHACCALGLLAALPSWAAWYDVSAGPVELRLTETRVERLLVRDRFVFGDPREYRGPAIAAELLDRKWHSVLAEGERQPPQVVGQDDDGATIRLAGEFRGKAGGRWPWRMELVLQANRKLVVEYRMQEAEAPQEPVAFHRLSFTYPSVQALGPGRRPEHAQEPGRPVTTTDRAGKTQTGPFGSEPNIIAAPKRILLPWDERHITLVLSDNVGQVEYWQGGWAQRINLSLPRPGEEVVTRVEIDLSELARQPLRPVSLREVADPLDRWRTHPVERLPQPARVLRMVQSLPAYSDKTDAEMDQLCRDLAKHFDVVQLHWAYYPWKYLQAQRDEQARAYLEGKVKLIQRWIDACRRAGLEPALSVNWSPPVANKQDLKAALELQGERFEPKSGKFVQVEGAYDWGSAEAAKVAADALEDIASRLKGVSYQWFDEPCYKLHTWFEAPFFSKASLADYRRFVGDREARFPAKPYAADTERTNNRATAKDWADWYRWVQSVYTRMIRGWVEAVAKANADNPDYRGAIWFQHNQWWGREYGIDLDQVFAIPGLTWVVCEYCTDASNANYKAFKHYAIRHGKHFSTFVNVGWYDATQPGSVRYQGTPEGYRKALEFCFAEHAAAITAYPSWSFQTSSKAFNPERVRIWDEVMAAHGLQRHH